jgi:hypothetical protein
MRGHPKHRDDADDDCSNDEFDQTVAAQLAQGILGGERARDLRFSTFGIASVGTLLVMGSINTWYLVGSFAALTDTDYAPSVGPGADCRGTRRRTVAVRAMATDIGVLMALPETDRGAKALLFEFKRGLAESGWIDGGNILMDIRWAGGDVNLMRKFANELVTLNPDLILSNSTPVTAALQRATQTIPIVFVIVGDPLGSGFVASLAHPGGNITGLGMFEESIASKWLDLLTQIAPGFPRATFTRAGLPASEFLRGSPRRAPPKPLGNVFSAAATRSRYASNCEPRVLANRIGIETRA